MTLRGRAGDRIERVDIVRCVLPLDKPVHIGRTVYREREYVALRLTTADGTEGHAIGYSRGLPLDAMLRPLVRELLGCRVSRRAAILDRLWGTRINAAPSLGRAFSLVDIALADALARATGLPLWRLLGGARSRVAIMAVAGYHAGDRGADAVADEVRALADAGFRSVKLHTADAVVAARVRAAAPDVALGVDVGMAWRSLTAALHAARDLDDLDLAFIEDPFTPARWRLTGELAGRLRTPVAAGEDVAGPTALREMAGVVGVLRVDATVSGGFAAVLDAAVVASEHGALVMTHALPDQHAHLAGSPPIETVEMIPDDSGVNPIGRLLARRQTVEAGDMILSEEPGHGAPLDWAAIEANGRDHTSHRAEATEVEGCS